MHNNASSEKLYDLSKKLATLIAILYGQRPKEILGLIDLRNLWFEENFLVIRIGDTIKTWNKKSTLTRLNFHSIEKVIKFVSSHVKEYLKLPANLTGNITRLFITTTKSYKIASQDTLARGTKTTLRWADINMSIFIPHSTRSTPTSRSATGIPTETVLKTRWWRSMRTFTKHLQ